MAGNQEAGDSGPQHRPEGNETDIGSGTQDNNISSFPERKALRGYDPGYSPKGAWDYLRVDIQKSLATNVTDLRDSLKRQSETLSSNVDTQINERLAVIQNNIHSHLQSSFSSLRDEQDKKDQNIINQLDAFSKHFLTLQAKKDQTVLSQLHAFNEQNSKREQAFDRLSTVLEQSYILFQKGSKELEPKIGAIDPNGQNWTPSLIESFQQHRSKIDELAESRLDTLLAATQEAHKKLRDTSEKLNKQTEALAHNEGAFAQKLTNSFEDHRDQITLLVKSHLDSPSASYQQSHAVLEDHHKALKATLQKLARTVSEGSREQRSEISALSESHSEHKETLGSGFAAMHNVYEELGGKIDAIRSDHQRLTHTWTESFNNLHTQVEALGVSHEKHKHALDDSCKVIDQAVFGFESVLGKFLAHIHVEHGEESQELRRKRADQVCRAL